MRDRLKILDCNRKNVLGLPANAFKLWFCYYMNEDDEQESFMSYAEIEAQTGMGKTSVQKWNHFLEKHGWIVDAGKTAYDKWLALDKVPTPDSKRITCWRVDDPTVHRKETDQSVKKQLTSPSESDHKVYSYGSGLGSSSSSGYRQQYGDWPTSTSVSHGGPDSTPLVEPKPQTKTNGSLAPDGTSWSKWDAHDQVWKTAKLIELGKTKAPAVPVSEYLEELDGPSAPPSKEKTKNQNPIVFCFQCKLEPVRSKTSDYCTHCWERRKPKLPA